MRWNQIEKRTASSDINVCYKIQKSISVTVKTNVCSNENYGRAKSSESHFLKFTEYVDYVNHS